MQSIRVSWYDEHHHILVIQFEEGWDWPDLYIALVQVHDMVQASDSPIVQIFDMSECSQLPGNMFQQGRKLLQRPTPPQIKAVITVIPNPYLQAVYRAFHKMFPKTLFSKWNLSFVESLDDALSRTQQMLK